MSDRFDNIRIKPEPEEDNHPESDIEEYGSLADSEIPRPASPTVPEELSDKSQTIRPAGRVPRKKRREYKHAKLLFWGLVPVFLALVYIVGSYLIVPAVIQGPVVRKLSATLNRSVAMNRVTFSPFSLQLFVHDISISGRHGDTTERYLLDCRKLQGQIGLEMILQQQLVIHQLEIDGLSLNLERSEEGSFNIDQVVRFFQPGQEAARESLWPEWLVLDGINVIDSQILVDDLRTRKQHRIEQIAFYLPSTDNLLDTQSVLPQLNAVVNSSPVQVNGHRSRNSEGQIETRFNLTLSQVVLGNYLKYIPVTSTDRLKLAEGQADINLSLIVPASSTSQNILLNGTASGESVRVLDEQNNTVFKAPQAYVDFSISPVAKQFHFNKIVLDSPELYISSSGKTDGKKQLFSFRDLGSLISSVKSTALTISCDHLMWNNGIVKIVDTENDSPGPVWKNVTLSLNGYTNTNPGTDKDDAGKAASIVLSGQGEAATTPMKFSVSGDLFPDSSMKGKVSVSNLDLKKYAPFLPAKVRFKKGRGEFEGKYAYGNSEKKGPIFRISDGSFMARDFDITGSKKKSILAGAQLSCSKLETDIIHKELSCNRLETVQSEIYGDRVEFAGQKKKLDDKDWKVLIEELHIKDSTLFTSLTNPINNKKDIKLKLGNFTLKASGLGKTGHTEDNLHMSGVFAKGGSLSVSGVYSLAKNTGRLQTELKDVGSSHLNPFLTPWFIPVIRDGRVHMQGTYIVEKNQFDGSFVLDSFVAGHRKESYVSIQKISAEAVHMGLKPFVVTIDELRVDDPVIVPGLSNAGKTLHLFLRESKKKKGKNRVEINTIHLNNGRYRLAEPILMPGYQPELADINGKITSIGFQTLPASYSFEGVLDDRALIRISGIAEKDDLSSYSLNVSGFPLEKFGSFFQEGGGLNTSQGLGNWHQIMLKEGDRQSVSSRVTFKNILPDMDSPYARIASLYLDNDHTFRIDIKDSIANGDNRQFLFHAVINNLQRDAVKAELSEKLVLERLLPEVTLDEKVYFAPGTAILVDPASLRSFRKLLHKRPYLLLELEGGVDPESDKTSLHNILLQEEEVKREAENKRRQLEREKILEREKAKLAAMKDKPGQVVEEPIQPWELVDLQPLPPAVVSISDEMLAELAGKRAVTLRKYCISQLSLPAERINVSDKSHGSGAFVQIHFQPYMNQQVTLDEVKPNDTKTDRTNENRQAL